MLYSDFSPTSMGVVIYVEVYYVLRGVRWCVIN